MESLELFGKEVLPEFAERDEQYQREKAKRLEPVIEQVLARKPADDHPPLPSEKSMSSRRFRVMADRFGNDEFHKMLDTFAEQSALGPSGIETLINNRQ